MDSVACSGRLISAAHRCDAFPEGLENTPVPVTEANRNFVYSTTLSMLIVMKLVIACVFFYLVVIAGGQEKSLGGWFFPVVLIGIFGPLVYFCRKCSRGARAIENMAQNGKSAS